MLRDYLYKSILFVATFTLFNCGGSDSSESKEVLPPEVASLASPLKNEECNQGNVVSETESRVTFEWSNANNATSYTVVLENLISNTTQESVTSNTNTTIILLRNTPYSWYVVSKSNSTSETATSEKWHFYNAGEGITNYAPFPAEAINPRNSQTTGTTVTLEWEAMDIDNDITSYDVYLDTTNPPTQLQQADVTNITISDISLTADTAYYWMVITKDEAENTSKSQIFEFRTE